MSDRILGAACLVAGAGMAWAAQDYAAPISYEPVGPRAFPLLLAGLMVLAGSWLIARPGPHGFGLQRDHFKPIGLAIVAVFVYAGLFETLGFPLATAAMAMPVGMAFGGSWKQSLAGGVVMGLVLYVLFDKLLDVVLPTGLLSFVFGGTLMDTLQYLLGGFSVALTPTNLSVAAIGAFIGTIVGMLPGLGPINGVAILMPLAFALKLPPETALILLAAVYMGCEYGGRISSILLNVPGDAGAIMTALDGHPMAKKGLGGVALSISAWSSFVGSLIATVGIVLFAPLLARWALAFGPAEYFALMCFAFACITGLMGDAPVKAALAAVIGLSLSTVGLDSNSGVYRFTGGDVHLSDGIQFIVVVIGVFSVSEILLMLEQHHSSEGLIQVTGRKLFNLKEMAFTWWGTVRSSVVGFIVGVLPGAGATIASAMTYSMEKRMAGPDGHFGDGDIRGVAAPEAANNASAAGSFVPMLTLGVPGSGTTAVMVGALSLYNITPGPALFTQNPTLVWGLIASLFIANVMLLIINIPMVGVFTKVLRLPNWALVPGILAVSAVGVYSVHATTFDLLLMSGLGVAGYLLRKQGMPMAPLILGFVLGDLMEQNLRRALSITNGELGILVESPISIGLWVGAVAMVVVPPVMRLLAGRKPVAATT